MDNNDEDKETLRKLSLIKELFFNLFRQKGFASYDSFGFNVWFLQKNIKKGKSPNEYFEELMNSTPREDDDIIKFLLIKSFHNSKNNNGRIYVQHFIEEISNQIIKLDYENTRIDTLIEKYEAYETVTTIDQNIIHFDKYEERACDISKSTFTASISKIKNINKGDYKFSLLMSSSKDIDDIVEELEYKLNHVISIKEDKEEISFPKNEYEFPHIDFFCKDDSKSGTESGTNLLNFQLKMENLSKNYSDFILSDRYKFLELLIGNVKALLNNFQKTKTLNAQVVLLNSFYDITVNLVVEVEFDPITLMAVFNKIKQLLQNIISYKVRIEHKLKTIMSYFENISDDINRILHPIEKEDSGCSLL